MWRCVVNKRTVQIAIAYIHKCEAEEKKKINTSEESVLNYVSCQNRKQGQWWRYNVLHFIWNPDFQLLSQHRHTQTHAPNGGRPRTPRCVWRRCAYAGPQIVQENGKKIEEKKIIVIYISCVRVHVLQGGHWHYVDQFITAACTCFINMNNDGKIYIYKTACNA